MFFPFTTKKGLSFGYKEPWLKNETMNPSLLCQLQAGSLE